MTANTNYQRIELFMSKSTEYRLSLMRQTDTILAEVKANSALLDKCIGPHAFCICLDRHTKQPIEGTPTFEQRFAAWWRCAKCGGRVENLHKIWYERGVEHGRREMAWRIHANAKVGAHPRFDCPQCGAPLLPVEYPADCMLNEYQWRSQIAGDLYCDYCKSNTARSGHLYFWKRNLTPVMIEV